MSQSTRILKHLGRGKSLTPLGALKLFRCFRLGARIHDLKAKGFPIVARMVQVGGKRVASYRMARA